MENKWLMKIIDVKTIDNENVQKSIEKLINEGVIKKFLGQNHFSLKFIYKIKDEDYVLKNIKSNVQILSIMEYLSNTFKGTRMSIRTRWRDEISLYYEDILDILKQGISKNRQEEIFESDCPASELKNMFTMVGRDSFKMLLQTLFNEIDTVKFK